MLSFPQAIVTYDDYMALPKFLGIPVKSIVVEEDKYVPYSITVTIYKRWYQPRKHLQRILQEEYDRRRIALLNVEVIVI